MVECNVETSVSSAKRSVYVASRGDACRFEDDGQMHDVALKGFDTNFGVTINKCSRPVP